MKRENIIAFDEKKISLCVWDDVAQPKAVLQFLHGMAEHVARYDQFARFLNEQGIIFVADDHRAHGYTDENNLGKGTGGNIFEDTIKDEKQITALLKERYKGVPLIVMGHSYGSFLTQRYLLDKPEISGAILCGSALMEGFMVNVGYSISRSKCKKGKNKEPGNIFAKLTFKAYDKKFRAGLNAWLSRDVVEVGKYNTDNFCGFTCSNEFYFDFFSGLKKVAAERASTDKNAKLFIVSGGNDMVGGKGALVKKLFDSYTLLGLTPELKLYDGARHELTNETNRMEMFNDVSAFVLKCATV